MLKKQDEVRTNLLPFSNLALPTPQSLSCSLSQTNHRKLQKKADLFLSDVYLFTLERFNKLLVVSHLAA